MMLYIYLILILILSYSDGSVLPKFPPTYVMNESTIIMTCNTSGMLNEYALTRLSKYGIVDIDWSNAKSIWAKSKPMNTQELLEIQAKAIKSYNKNVKVWVYRNFAKALPWFYDVREKLTNPLYDKWFIKFKPQGPYHVNPCNNQYGGEKCSMFYHDYLQSPGEQGYCKDCDCGKGLPCGEYIFDHRNESLREWIANEFIFNSGLSSPYIDGFYVDDSWTDYSAPILPWQPKEGYCDHSKNGGVTEEDRYCVQDMGLTAEEVRDVYHGWQISTNLTTNQVLNKNGYLWYLLTPITGSPNSTMCTNWLRNVTLSSYENKAILYSYTNTFNDDVKQFEIDLAIFLLIRGNYAWLGYTWNDCHDEWVYHWNSMLDYDYGHPLNSMKEVSNGVFMREWSNGNVTMNCNDYTAKFEFNGMKRKHYK